MIPSQLRQRTLAQTHSLPATERIDVCRIDELIPASQDATDGVIAPATNMPTLALLLTGHIICDGEVILLLLKPSLWYIVLASLRFSAAVVIGVIAGIIYLNANVRAWTEFGAFLIAGRVTWAVLVWMSRLYILTDLRIVRLRGVFRADIYACPLRKIARTRLLITVRERVVGVGSIEIISADEEIPDGMWQTVAKPREVHEQIVAAVNRAKQAGRGE